MTIKTYRICYRMECFVEAESENEAMQKYEDGEGEDAEYVEFLSLEEVHPSTHIPINET